MTSPRDSRQEEESRPFSGVASWFGASPEHRKWYGRAAAALFIGVAVASAWGLPPVEIHWGWLAAVAVMLLFSISALAAEYRLSGWLVEKRVGWKEALRVTILSSAANLLPIPGGLMVRTGALQKKGSAWTTALGSHVVLGLGWLGVALLLAGLLLFPDASVAVAGSFVVLGGLALAAMWIGAARVRKNGQPLVTGGAVIALETVYVLVSAIRLYAVLSLLGLPVTMGQATALTVASALAAGLGFFPGGLGLRELLAGALSPLVGLAPAVGAFAGVVDRIVGLVLRGLLASLLWRSGPDSFRGAR